MDEVNAVLQIKSSQGPLTFAEIGNLCPRSKNIKSKCRKVSQMLEADPRFHIVDDDKVELAATSLSEEIASSNADKSVDYTPHASFLLYMSALPEEDVVISEQSHDHLERHYTVWKKSVDAQQHEGIEKIHFTQIIDSLKDTDKLHLHAPTSRLVLETYSGRIAARIASLSRQIPDHDEEPMEGEKVDDRPGAFTNITGTSFKDVKFLDFTEYELNMFGDTGVGHGYVVRGPNYTSDGNKVDTGNALFRMVAAEIIEVEGATRYDHVASMGRTKQRIEALLRLLIA